MDAHTARHFHNQLILASGLRTRSQLWVATHTSQTLPKANILRWVKDEHQNLRLRQMLRTRRARGIGARKEVLASIVIERKKLRQSMRCVTVHMIARGAHCEDERMGQHGGDARVELHRVVLRSFHFRLVNRN